MNTENPVSEPEFVLTRVFDAPRELVFQAWTDPERLQRWWGPHGFTARLCTVDLRPGGRFHLCMCSPDGQDIWVIGKYQEIVPPERLVFSHSFSDAAGNVLTAAAYGMAPDWPEAPVITVILEEHQGKTTMTMRGGVPVSLAQRYGAPDGWGQSFDRLAELLASG